MAIWLRVRETHGALGTASLPALLPAEMLAGGKASGEEHPVVDADEAAAHPVEDEEAEGGTATRSGHELKAAAAARRFGAIDHLDGEIITVAAWKGGTGKSELAKELAYLLNGILVDFDWDQGNISVAWGYLHETRTTAPLLDALERGTVPRPLVGGRTRPDLVPAHPDFAYNQPEPKACAVALDRWARAWGRPVIVDTHPGGVPSTYGAVSAARVVVVPVKLAERDLNALEGMLKELVDYPILVIPVMVPRVPPERQVSRLERITRQAGVPVGPPVSEYKWLERRTRRMAISYGDPSPAAHQPFVEEMTAIARAVSEYVRRAA